MTEAEFLTLYKDTLAAIEDVIEAAVQADVAVDYESGNDMLTIIFDDESVAIISRQSAVCQLWLAARSGGFHFNYDADMNAWICTLDGRTLTDKLTTICREQGRLDLHFG